MLAVCCAGAYRCVLTMPRRKEVSRDFREAIVFASGGSCTKDLLGERIPLLSTVNAAIVRWPGPAAAKLHNNSNCFTVCMKFQLFSGIQYLVFFFHLHFYTRLFKRNSYGMLGVFLTLVSDVRNPHVKNKYLAISTEVNSYFPHHISCALFIYWVSLKLFHLTVA